MLGWAGLHGGYLVKANGCVFTPTPSAPCSDGDECTTGDVCGGTGTCTPGGARSCTDGDPCTADSCAKLTGCVFAPQPGFCDDDNACTQDSCKPMVGCQYVALSTGTCCASAAACDDTNPCTDDACDSKLGCQHTHAAGPCTDGSLCTIGDSCQQGDCVPGDALACAPPGACHTAGTCTPTTGTCTYPPSPNGTACDDANACTASDLCQAGVCKPGIATVCTAVDGCHQAGTCQPATGACTSPVRADGYTCDDSNACTAVDACSDGTCVGETETVCTAADACHSPGTCHPVTGACSKPIKADATPCSDGNPCTTVDGCLAGACQGSTPVVCMPSDSCHNAGTCQVATGQCSNPAKANGSPCDDDDPCTTSDLCGAGACLGTAVPCDDANACTTDTCQPGSGCAHVGLADGAACSGGKCDGGDCVPAGMVLVPAGDFWMGCQTADSLCGQEEKPLHRVTLSAYYIDITEVTVAHYTSCVSAGGCTPPTYSTSTSSSFNYGQPGRGEHPVNAVNLTKAVQYCSWRGARLPTEAEWEKAARGGCEKYPAQDCQAAATRQPWGNAPPSCYYARMNEGTGASCGSFTISTAAVGSYPAGKSPYGIVDMVGNVMEWTSDWYHPTYYSFSPITNPLGPQVGTQRVLKGTDFTATPSVARISDRNNQEPSVSTAMVGFRCAKSLSN